MKPNLWLRGIGVIGLVTGYFIFVTYGENFAALLITITGVIALVSPELVDRLPWLPDV